MVSYDDYFGIIIRDKYQKRVQNICNETVDESKAYIHKYSVSYFDNSLTAQNTIDDAISMGESMPLNTFSLKLKREKNKNL